MLVMSSAVCLPLPTLVPTARRSGDQGGGSWYGGVGGGVGDPEIRYDVSNAGVTLSQHCASRSVSEYVSVDVVQQLDKELELQLQHELKDLPLQEEDVHVG